MKSTDPLYALIVGIDQYVNPILRPLEGAVRDAELMKTVFRDHFAVPEENIVLLTDSSATREGITKAFREHLIDRAKAASKTDEDPSFVFCYAGHGSRARDKSGTQPDGKDETMVPHDSRTEGVFDIKDWELGGWLDELTSHTHKVTVVLDCCHSGSGTRTDEDDEGSSRQCIPDLREQPIARPPSDAPATRSTAAMTTAAQEKYTLLAACRNDQSAKEYTVPDTEKNIKHGAYTWFLAQELMNLPPGHTPTCREVHERVKHRVHKKYRSQVPQCEGDRDRLLFGGVNAVREPLMTVNDIRHRDGSIWIDGGLAHGITNGAKLNLYPPDTRVVDETTTLLGTLTVDSAKAVRSRCSADGDIEVEKFSRVALKETGTALSPRSVVIDIDDPDIRSEVKNAIQNSDAAPYCEIASETAGADFILGQNEDGEITTCDGGRQLIVEPVPNDELQTVASDLAALCRYQNVLELENRSRTSDLYGKIRVTFHRVVDPPEDDTATQEQRKVRSVVPIPTTQDGMPIVEMGTPIAIEIHNDWTKPVYCEAISFGYDYAIVPLTELVAPGSRKRVTPGGTIWFGRDSSDHLIKFMEPEDPGFMEAREHLKIVATEEEADYEVLRQGGLRVPLTHHRTASDSPLDQLFAMAMAGSRALGVERVQMDKNDWTTVTQDYLVTKPAERKRHAVNGGQKTEIPGYELSVETPEGLDCQISVLSESTNTRAASADDPVRPGGLVLNSDFLQPVSLISERCSGLGGEAIEIEADADALAKVSDQNPICLRLSGQSKSDEATIAIAWDGEVSYPVGISHEDGRVHIDWLPDADSRSDEDAVDDAGNRSLMRCVKLYLFRTFKLTPSELGLHRAEFVAEGASPVSSVAPSKFIKVDGGHVLYFDADDVPFEDGDKAVLLVNGFPCGSENLVENLWPLLSEKEYGHVFTFDYEGYGTSISDNGETLFKQLSKLGFSKDDKLQLDVIAHGTGALVARTMVELEAGREFVDRCICSGSPNEGIVLAGVKDATHWIGGLLLDLVPGGNLITKSLSLLLKQTDSNGQGFADLAADSPFLKLLEKQGNRGDVEYHLVAGCFDPTADAGGAVERLWQRACDTGKAAISNVKGEPHDLFATKSSMLSLSQDPNAPGPKSTEEVPGHHFGYYTGNKAISKLAQKL